jgi:hypothetical protein
MISLRLAVPAVLAAGAVAGCFTYFVTPPGRVEVDQRLSPTVPYLIGPDTRASKSTDQPPTPTAEEKAADAYREAAAAILGRSPNARAFAGADEPPITGRIPLPKSRPIARP